MSAADPTVVTPAVLREWPLPSPGGDKSSRGRVLVVGGSVSTPGAVLLAGEAALRSGAGKLTLAVPHEVAATLAVAVPESKVVGAPGTSEGSIDTSAAPELASVAERVDAVLVGSGFVDTDDSVSLCRRLLPRLRVPVVLDALASAYLTEHPEGLQAFEGAAVLTVNKTELARTAGRADERVDEDPYSAAADVARRSGVVVVLGGEGKLVGGRLRRAGAARRGPDRADRAAVTVFPRRHGPGRDGYLRADGRQGKHC